VQAVFSNYSTEVYYNAFLQSGGKIYRVSCILLGGIVDPDAVRCDRRLRDAVKSGNETVADTVDATRFRRELDEKLRHNKHTVVVQIATREKQLSEYQNFVANANLRPKDSAAEVRHQKKWIANLKDRVKKIDAYQPGSSEYLKAMKSLENPDVPYQTKSDSESYDENESMAIDGFNNAMVDVFNNINYDPGNILKD
jgi:hypothetical protein